jgi:hypothetical protein
MRTIMVAVLAIMASVAMADDSNDAHRQAVSGRDSYWNCLAQQYSRDSTGACRERILPPLSPARVLPSGRIFG